MSLISPEQWKPADSVQLERAAEEVVRSDGNVIVAAGPGSGKTEMLAQKAYYLLTTMAMPKVRKILAISFKKDSAANLADRVVRRCGDNGRYMFVSRTYDAFAKAILDHFRMALPDVMRPPAEYLLGNESGAVRVLSDLGMVRWQPSTFAEYVNALEFPLSQSSPDESIKIWTVLIKGTEKSPSFLTYNIVMRLATYIIESNPLIREAINCAYSHVMLDEFQDTTSRQYALLNACFCGRKNGITAVGDEDQRIMEWAGAMPQVFADFSRDYDAVQTRLIINHRSAPRIIRLQAEVHKWLNSDSEYLVQPQENVSDELGTVKLIESDTDTLEAQYIAKEIEADVRAGINPRNIGVLCRIRTDLFIGPIRSELARVGIEIRDESEMQDLLKAPLTRIVIDMFSLILNKNQGVVRNRLANMLLEFRKIDVDSDSKVNECADKIAAVIRTCNEIIKVPVFDHQFDLILADVIGCFGKDNIKHYYAEYNEPGLFRRQINEIADRFKSFLNNSAGDFRCAYKKFIGDSIVPLMTIHKSKGLEFDSVYFLGLEDRKFFNMRLRPEEETRAFYVALSRAKNKLVFAYSKLRDSQLQSHEEISSFFEMLKHSGIAEMVHCGRG